jgi:hypothetical protein
VEYLAAPYDPAVDTPGAKPYAHMRYRQRGHGTPWTDAFAEIILEFGNETWHNGVFEDWLGFHKHHWVHAGGPEYGFFAQYLIDVIKSSPYWASEGLDGKVRFVLGGNYEGRRLEGGGVAGYVEEAMLNAPGAHYAGHANYVGPKWETGDASQSTFDDHGVQETLIGFLSNVRDRQVEMGRTQDYLATQGTVYDIVAYEGGPSGYALPGSTTPEQVETNERYGKSLAMAVAALDAWMLSYEYGWTWQAFLGYGQGSHWNSHTPFLEGFRPTPGWQALAMRNRHASGDLMRVVTDSAPTYERQPGETYPLAGAYALRDGATWSVFLVSRKLDGQHNGHDFGDGSTPVTLRLPFDRAERITLHRLTGDPRDSNRFAMNIAPEEVAVPASAVQGGRFTVNDATGGIGSGLPAGSIYLYVFETQAGAPDADGDGLSDADETRDLDPLQPGTQNPFDPSAADSTGDLGGTGADGVPDGANDWDGDGWTNAEEFAFGTNPLDAANAPVLPTAGRLGGAALACALAAAGLATARLRRN